MTLAERFFALSCTTLCPRNFAASSSATVSDAPASRALNGADMSRGVAGAADELARSTNLMDM